MGVLDGKAAIVTGSARGIGRATAEILTEQGAKVLVNDLDGDVAEQAAGEIGGGAVSFSGDLTKENVCDQMVDKAIEAFGRSTSSSTRRLHMDARSTRWTTSSSRR